MNSIKEKLSNATVAIAGLGGLGSNVAVALARAGIGKLIIADFDKVEPDNLTRQHYFIDQIGRSKVECTLENLAKINPEVRVTGHDVTLDAEKVTTLFSEADIIAECFDKAQTKQMIVETILTKTDKPIVSVSGLAGYGDSNSIRTRRISKRLVLIGDCKSGIDSVPLLLASRVGIAAYHQANAIIEFLVDHIKR
jgi:sulfur carrier protein ThiS adenylyltransferase